MILTRIRLLAGIFIGLSFLVALGLASLMLIEHEDWLERSYRNRWAYRDVPSRRGAILDRRERVIRVDRPGVDLELQYWAFRREHPLGIALHGANLLLEARKNERRFSFREPQLLVKASELLLAMPCALLREGEFTAEQARDLLFYAYSLLKSLSGLSSSEIIPPLRVAAREGLEISVLDALRQSRQKEDPVGDWATFDPMPVLRERLAQMEALSTRLRIDAKPDFELWRFLDERRQLSESWRLFAALPLSEREALSSAGFAEFVQEQDGSIDLAANWRAWLELDEDHRDRFSQAFLDLLAEDEGEDPVEPRSGSRLDLPPDEARPILARRRLAYEQARWFGLLQEWHPGWILRTSVERIPGPEAELPSLGSLVGRVRGAWKEDGPEVIDRQVARVIDAGTAREFERELGGVPEVMQGSMRSSLRATVRNYYRREGRLGTSGVERDRDDLLAGRPGLRMVERDRLAREQQMFRSLEVAPGRSVTMSIDLDLQRMLEQVLRSDVAMGALERAMVILDAQNGEILAMGALLDPPAEAGKPKEAALWSPGASYPNPTPYVGSVVKPFVLLEHLDAIRHGRQFSAHELFLPCERVYQKDVRRTGRMLVCDGVHGTTARDPIQALAVSCNIFYYQAVAGLGNEGFGQALKRVGWKPIQREKSRILEGGPMYQEEVPGVPYRHDPKLLPGRIVLEMQGIGYGVEVNAMQVARAYAGLATGSLPSISLIAGEGGEAVPLQVSSDDLRTVQNGLRACVLRGTASRVAGLQLPGLEVHGKTGTAEVSTDGELNNAWFAGFIGRGADASIAFAAVAYRDRGHGADVGGEMIARFLARAAANPKTAGYLVR